MRLMLQFTIPIEQGNRVIQDGRGLIFFKDMAIRLNAEAAYFFLRDGKRAGMMIFESTDQASLVAINEAFFDVLNADVEIQPVLKIDELMIR